MTMAVNGLVTRTDGVIWRDIAGEVVIVGEESRTVRMLNRTASVIWLLADGTRDLEDIAGALSERFDVSPGQARADAEEFCSELAEAGLVTVSGSAAKEHRA